LDTYNNHPGSSFDKDSNNNEVSRTASNYNCGTYIYIPGMVPSRAVPRTPCGGSTSQITYPSLKWFQDKRITHQDIENWMNNQAGGTNTRRSASASSRTGSIGKSVYMADSKRRGQQLSCHIVLTGMTP